MSKRNSANAKARKQSSSNVPSYSNESPSKRISVDPKQRWVDLHEATVEKEREKIVSRKKRQTMYAILTSRSIPDSGSEQERETLSKRQQPQQNMYCRFTFRSLQNSARLAGDELPVAQVELSLSNDPVNLSDFPQLNSRNKKTIPTRPLLSFP
jgi:hypothetical protein